MPAEKGKVSKRIRVNFNFRQLEAMETVFKSTQYPDPKVISLLSERLDIPMEKICTWYQNRRSKFRKESKKGHINWMREQFYGGLSSDQGCTMKPEGCYVNRGEVSPPANGSASHVLTPPATPNSQECPAEYRIPTASVHHRPRPQWNNFSPPGPLHIQASAEDMGLQGLPTPPALTMPSHMTTTSDILGVLNSAASSYSYSNNQSGYQPYGTLLSACNSPYSYGDLATNAPTMSNTGNTTNTHAQIHEYSLPMTPSVSNQNYDCAPNVHWNGHYDRMYNGFGTTQQQYNYNTTYHAAS